MRLFGRIVTVTGWTFTYIKKELTWPELLSLTEYWEESPPLHEVTYCMAQGFGLKKESNSLVNNKPLEALGLDIPGIIVTRNKKTPLAPARS